MKKKLNRSLFFHKTLLLAPGWIYYSYSHYRLSQRFLYKRFKYFYKVFHRIYCFLPFILSPSPSISLRAVCTSAKSLAPNQMSSHCLPTVPPSSFSQLLHPHHSILVSFMSPSPAPISTFAFCTISHGFVLTFHFSCFGPAIPASQETHTGQQTHNYKEGSVGQVSFNQHWGC